MAGKTTEEISFALEELFARHGYRKYCMTRFEEYSFYIENKNFLNSDRFITFNDVDGKLMALKPDISLSIAKNLSGGRDRVYYNESVFRADTGGFKELRQTGLELIGEVGPAETIEVLLLALLSLGQMGRRYVLNISHMGYITGVIEELGLSAADRLAALSFVKAKSRHGLIDFLKSRGVDEDKICSDEINTLFKSGDIESMLGGIPAHNEALKAAVAELERVCGAFRGTEFADRIRIDFTFVSDTEYYNGLLFSGFIDGAADAVLTGGRYDHLLKKLGKKAENALGFAVGYKELGRLFGGAPEGEYTLLLCDEKTDTQKALSLLLELEKRGERVICAASVPSDRKIKKIIKVGEDNA